MQDVITTPFFPYLKQIQKMETKLFDFFETCKRQEKHEPIDIVFTEELNSMSIFKIHLRITNVVAIIKGSNDRSEKTILRVVDIDVIPESVRFYFVKHFITLMHENNPFPLMTVNPYRINCLNYKQGTELFKWMEPFTQSGATKKYLRFFTKPSLPPKNQEKG